MDLIRFIIFFNGVYDIFCGINILLFYKSSSNIFANLHPSIFIYNKDVIDPIFYRLLAYWIITYGTVRICYFHNCKLISIVVSLTYIIEAFVYCFEYFNYASTIGYKTLWVSTSSIIISYLSHVSHVSHVSHGNKYLTYHNCAD